MPGLDLLLRRELERQYLLFMNRGGHEAALWSLPEWIDFEALAGVCDAG